MKVVEDTEELVEELSSFDMGQGGGSDYDSEEVADTMGEVVDAMGEVMEPGYTGGYGLTQKLKSLVPMGVSVSKVVVKDAQDAKVEEMKFGMNGLGINDSGKCCVYDYCLH